MAAPESSTLENMTGRWVVDKSLSDDFGAFLKIQGIPWWKRQAVGLITVHEHITHSQNENKIDEMIIDQQITGGFQGGREHIVVDGSERIVNHQIFGDIKERAVWSDLSEVDDDWLKEGWSNSPTTTSDSSRMPHLKVSVTNETLGWVLVVVWGFIIADGKRHHCRRLICRKKDEVERVRSVYGWVDSS